MLWLVTPVHGREALTRICFEQRARLLEELHALGVPAGQVVIGNDANLATARAHGFTVLERPNLLGLRINDGFEWACREGGATHVVYTGSDDFMMAAPLADLPAPGRVRASGWNAWVGPEGEGVWVVDAPPNVGDAPWTVSRGALEPCGFRPCDDTLMSGLDTSMLESLGEERFDFRPDDDPLRWVGFKGGDEQITDLGIQVIGARARYPFGELARVYPPDIVERMQSFYTARGRQ